MIFDPTFDWEFCMVGTLLKLFIERVISFENLKKKTTDKWQQKNKVNSV